MAHIPQEVIPLFESGIYLPMLLFIVNNDIENIERSNFKLKSPYIQLLEEVRRNIEKDLVETKQEFKRCDMKLKRGEKDRMFTEYYFYYKDIVELRRYSNIRLRNQSEHLYNKYLHFAPVNF